MTVPAENAHASSLPSPCSEFAAFLARPCDAGIDVDLSGHKPASGVVIHHDGPRLRMTWPMAEGEHGVLILQLSDNEPLVIGFQMDANNHRPTAAQRASALALIYRRR